MKSRFGYLIVAAITAVCFSLSAVADVESVTPAGFYQVEVTPQALGDMDAIAAQAAIEIQTEQSLEVFPEVASCNCTMVGHYVVYHEAPNTRTIEPDGSGVFAKVTDNGKTVNSFAPFKVGWKITSS